MFGTKANYRKAEQEAQRLLREFSVIDAPVPVEEMVENYGLKLYRGDFPSENGIAGYIDLAANEIVVNRADNVGRQTFTIAHELGHYVLHRQRLADDPDLGIMHRKPIGGEKDPYEQEANSFAANLLVPDFLLTKYYSYQPSWVVAKMFGVSEDVIRYRLKATGRA